MVECGRNQWRECCIGLEDCATAALVFAGLDLQSDAGGFSKRFVHTSILHSGTFYTR